MPGQGPAVGMNGLRQSGTERIRRGDVLLDVPSGYLDLLAVFISKTSAAIRQMLIVHDAALLGFCCGSLVMDAGGAAGFWARGLRACRCFLAAGLATMGLT